MTARHIFGPVLSRRLGLSLGIDLVPHKTCPYDCVYCECGCTTDKTLVRQEFFPHEEIIAELRNVLFSRPDLDSITFAGSGEPTLSRSIGPVIAFLKREYPEYIVTVLTNGYLLTDPEVREELLPADRVIPTLTSTFQRTFERIHRPPPGLTIDALISGLVEFRRMYHGALWLEVFVIPGINTTDEEIGGLAAAIDHIDPDAVQLNTLDRRPTEPWVKEAPAVEMERIAQRLKRPGITIAGRRQRAPFTVQGTTNPADLIRAMLHRRPSTLEDLVHATGLESGEVERILGMLVGSGEIQSQATARGLFWWICPGTGNRDGRS